MIETTKQWQIDLRNSIRKPKDLVQLNVISEIDLPQIEAIHSYFPFSITPHYASLINWQDPQDPLLRIVSPSLEEMDRAGTLDIGGEAESTQETGIQMKYPSTAVIFPIPACFSYCRFCFRKRLFNPEVRGEEILKNFETALDFIKNHPSVDNVLLTGGDPFMVKTPILRQFLTELRKVEHVKIIRFGTRGLVFQPNRFTSDPELLDLLDELSQENRRVYVVNHFNHPRELTPEVGKSVNALMKAGVVLANQSVMLRGVNDSPEIFRQLLNELAEWGITPYYVYQCTFIKASGHFRVPLRETIKIFTEATRGLNGLAKRVKLVMAHYSGKIEILGTNYKDNEEYIYLRYIQARDESQLGGILSYPLPRTAYWFDDLPGVHADPRLGPVEKTVEGIIVDL